jgi:peptidoglycan hydrolase CwlO-like protein
MNSRINDLQDQLNELQSKYSTSEKTRQKLQNQVNILTSDCETVNKIKNLFELFLLFHIHL